MAKNENLILTLLDRIALPGILPTKAGYEKLIIAEDLKKKIQLTQEELEVYQIVQTPTGGLAWKVPEGKEDAFTYEFTALEKNLIKEELKTLNDKNELLKDYLSLYTMFVLEPKN